MLSSKKILITGIHGFTGRYISEALRNLGNKVFGLSYQSANEPDIYSCDLRNGEKVSELVNQINPDYVIHLAAISFVGEVDSNVFYDVNVVGTCNLMKALERVDVKKVIVASSANIYGNPEEGLPICESRSPKPVNHYAASKLAMEHMVGTWEDKLPIIITRPFNYTGPGQEDFFLVPKIVSHFARKEVVLEMGNLDVSRDFTSVEDMVSAYIHLLDIENTNETVNICSGKAISLEQIVRWLREISGHELEVRINPDFVRNNEIKVLVGDNSHLKSLTGWVPTQSLKEVLKLMYAKSL